MEDSRLRLTKLQDDGFELVTNIRVAGDARETQRRTEEDDNRRQRCGVFFKIMYVACVAYTSYQTIVFVLTIIKFIE